MVVHPVAGVSIDLDKETKFNCGILHTNREIYRNWRSSFLFNNPLVLIMATSEIRTTFAHFDKLRKFLRKTFKYGYGAHTSMETIVSKHHENQPTGMNYILNFELQSPTTLRDLRINILPLVMETSTAPRNQTTTIQIWTPTPSGSSSITATHTINLHTLRVNVVRAIMDCVFIGPMFGSTRIPDIWTNGFGDVVETTARSDDNTGDAWKPASRVVRHKMTCYSILNLHPIDRHYRACETEPTCVYYDDEQFFLFRGEAKEVLPFLLKTIDGDPYYFKE